MLKVGPVWALGAMSGTSLDGVDAAMVLTDGERVLDFGPTAYRPYTEGERAVLRAALGRWPGEPGVAQAAEVVENAHAELLSGFSGVDLIGFHGQTLAHDPRGRGTHQAGNGALLAGATGVPVVWDFRSTDVRLGGQGAPLVPFYHHALARHIGAEEPLAFLNLGGVGNVTWVDPRIATPETACLAFDTGPANAPVNDLMLARLGQAQDEGGALAAQGHADSTILDQVLNSPYFYKMPPKSLDRNDFHGILDKVVQLSNADAARTLTAFAAAAVVEGLRHFPAPVHDVLVCGGGRHNETLMAELAQAFAYLAVRVARGLPTSAPTTTGVAASVGGGKISEP